MAKPTAEQRIERQRVLKNTSWKTVVAAFSVAAVVFIVFAQQGVGWAIVGFFIACGAFGATLFFGALIFGVHENAESNKRLAARDEQRRLEILNAEQIKQQQLVEDERKKQQQDDKKVKEKEERLAEQKRREDRQYLLRKLGTTVGYIDIYDPEDLKNCALLRQNISEVLSEILSKHEHLELRNLLEREPEVLGMIDEMEEHMKIKGIRNAQAVQIFAARPSRGRPSM